MLVTTVLQMMKHSILVWPVVAFALFAGCAGERSSSATPSRRKLTGTTWIVESINGKPITIPADAAKTLQLILGGLDQRVAVFGGVNRFGGSYQTNEAQLTFGPLIGTKMAGPPELNEQETSFADALAKVNRYQISGDTLVLFKDDQSLLTFKARS